MKHVSGWSPLFFFLQGFHLRSGLRQLRQKAFLETRKGVSKHHVGLFQRLKNPMDYPIPKHSVYGIFTFYIDPFSTTRFCMSICQSHGVADRYPR